MTGPHQPIELRLAAAHARRDELHTEAMVYREDLPRVDVELPGAEPARVAPIKRSVPRAQPQPAVEIHHPKTLGACFWRTCRALLAYLAGPRAF
ncbi:hypothetical protein [Caldimonas tepidiphila]|uniref:hypothetical protein n=1 Tax=Caldimonas tepidiphila TaxID=2315841 RepID=UPI000E5BEFC4|nr:hypothetical protein [Caldimonas tepidiphila]